MKNRRLMSMLLAMMMVMSMFASIPFTASAAESVVTVSDWDGLQKAVKNAKNWHDPAGQGHHLHEGRRGPDQGRGEDDHPGPERPCAGPEQDEEGR